MLCTKTHQRGIFARSWPGVQVYLFSICISGYSRFCAYTISVEWNMPDKKTIILDTNVILLNPRAIYDFNGNDVVIPISVIEELDKFKRNMDQLGRSAREFSRMLDQIRSQGNIHEGVVLFPEDNDAKISVLMASDEAMRLLPKALRGDAADNIILSMALQLKQEGKNVVFVSRDTNLRIKGDACGVPSIDYESDKIDIRELYMGSHDMFTSSDVIQAMHSQGKIKASDILPKDQTFYDNQFFLLQNEANPSNSALGRYFKNTDEIRKVFDDYPEQGIWGIHPRNKEQRYAFDLLLDDNIKLVSLVGIAGTGKTLLAIAAGLKKVADEGKYKKLLVSRPVFPMGKDIGYLPGDIKDKLQPWMTPIYDNVDFLIGAPEMDYERKSYQELFSQGIMEIEALTYIRGRSLPYQYFIVDEAQNLTPHEIKTIITRAGNGTKIVFTGDPYQIDNPYVDSSSNGLSNIVERFKGQHIAGHVTMIKGERSELAELAANIL
ncbi:PhoH family protein [Desulfurispirillum indicum S5]|uniref:PhoH family protein n=2 Tax=Desulfurispirillum TaxID=393029 RepID=E6W380_DESIS|nr:PhoH family protein [Desulfurispirillum indicum S5]